jgi:hypothetical protein
VVLLLEHPEFLLIGFMDKMFVPLKEGRRTKGAGQAPQNYMRASRIPKKKFVAKQSASAEICSKLLKQIASRSNLLKQQFSAKQFASHNFGSI